MQDGNCALEQQYQNSYPSHRMKRKKQQQQKRRQKKRKKERKKRKKKRRVRLSVMRVHDRIV